MGTELLCDLIMSLRLMQNILQSKVFHYLFVSYVLIIFLQVQLKDR